MTESIETNELEEQLILLYRFVSQINSLKRFYYSGMVTNQYLKMIQEY